MNERFPVSVGPMIWVAGILWLLSIVGVFTLQRYQQTDVGQFYLWSYSKASAATVIWGMVPTRKGAAPRTYEYQWLYGGCSAGGHPLGGGSLKSIGNTCIRTSMSDRDSYVRWVKSYVFGGVAASDLLMPVYIIGGLLLPVFFVPAAISDGRRRRQLIRGKQISGRRLQSVREYQQKSKKDGFTFYVEADLIDDIRPQ